MGTETHLWRHSPYFWYAAMPGLTGTFLLVFFAELTVWSVACGILLFTSSCVAGLYLSRLQIQHTPALSSNLRDLCLSSLPMWARQIDTSRRTGDEAVINLSHIFSVTVGDLEAALSASRSAATEISGKDGGILAALNSGETNLREVIEILKAEQHSKNIILADVTRFISDLKEMVGEVQHIALQVRMLSFNAAIEAAHAGKSGTGFNVVASEMRQLADLSAETGLRMVKKIEWIESIDQSLTNIFHEEESASDADTLSIHKADVAIQDVMRRFKQLTVNLSQSVEVMEKESIVIREKISDALVALQFQDRVSQIQAHVTHSLNALHDELKNGTDNALNAQVWMNRMAQEFSTEEEFDNLGSKGTKLAHKRPADEVTFF